MVSTVAAGSHDVQVMEEKVDDKNVEIASISSAEKRFHIYSSEELKAAIERLPAPSEPGVAV